MLIHIKNSFMDIGDYCMWGCSSGALHCNREPKCLCGRVVIGQMQKCDTVRHRVYAWHFAEELNMLLISQGLLTEGLFDLRLE